MRNSRDVIKNANNFLNSGRYGKKGSTWSAALESSQAALDDDLYEEEDLEEEDIDDIIDDEDIVEDDVSEDEDEINMEIMLDTSDAEVIEALNIDTATEARRQHLQQINEMLPGMWDKRYEIQRSLTTLDSSIEMRLNGSNEDLVTNAVTFGKGFAFGTLLRVVDAIGRKAAKNYKLYDGAIGRLNAQVKASKKARQENKLNPSSEVSLAGLPQTHEGGALFSLAKKDTATVKEISNTFISTSFSRLTNRVAISCVSSPDKIKTASTNITTGYEMFKRQERDINAVSMGVKRLIGKPFGKEWDQYTHAKPIFDCIDTVKEAKQYMEKLDTTPPKNVTIEDIEKAASVLQIALSSSFDWQSRYIYMFSKDGLKKTSQVGEQLTKIEGEGVKVANGIRASYKELNMAVFDLIRLTDELGKAGVIYMNILKTHTALMKSLAKRTK